MRPPQRLDIAANDIHADTAAGDIAHHRRGREARHENQIVDFLIARLGILGEQAARARLGQHACPVDARAIIAHLDDDAPRSMLGGEMDAALRRLAERQPRLGQFAAVIDGIAQQMRQRIGQLLDHGLVDFGTLTGHDQAHLLAQLGGEFAHQARHAREDRFDRLRANGHHRRPAIHANAVTGSPDR